MIVELRCVASGDYVAPAAVALHSFLRHNAWFDGELVAHCAPAEVDRVTAALSFLPRCRVVAVSPRLHDAVAALGLDASWVVERFWGLELLAAEATGDVLLLDADTCTIGSMDALCAIEGDVVACGEGAAHHGRAVDRATNAFADPTGSSDLIDKTFNSGMMRIAGTLLGAQLHDRALDVLGATDWHGLARRQHDQLVLNRLFEGAWVEADPALNFLLRHAGVIQERYGIGLAQARLLHFNVEPRPWQIDRSDHIGDERLAAATLRWIDAHAAVVRARSLAGAEHRLDSLRPDDSDR